ncbi:MAG: DUF3347 domain-containing protein [Opitutales bacterium]|nr:DUF3347 domain-containing protein [Opitutales bacterium]MCH8541077.1 cupredoxin domain-containing protein [Opitutales bacterium]
MNSQSLRKTGTIVALSFTLALFLAGCGGASSDSHDQVHQDDDSDHHHGDQAHVEGISTAAISSYISIQETLAADSMDGLSEQGVELGDAFEKIDSGAAEASRKIAETSDIEVARKHFETVSVALIVQLQKHNPTEGELFKAHCPMAFGNRGASWIQTDATINNPYFGSQMLRCGEIRDTFSTGSSDAHHHDHATAPGIEELPEGARTIRIIGKDYAFEPEDIEVYQGEVFALKLVNEGEVVHMWEIEERPETHVHAEVGQSATGVIRAPEEPGIYRTVCTEPGHEELGMTGRLLVKEKSSSSESPANEEHDGHSH